MKLPGIPNRTEAPIAYRLLLMILMSSSLVTLVITSIQLVSDYNDDIGNINNRLRDIKTSYVLSVAQSIWNFNQKQYDIQLHGILNLEDIVYVEILDPNGKLITAQGTNKSSEIIKRTYPLQTTDFGNNVSPGTLVVTASLSRVYQHLLHKTLLILVSQGLKTLLISSIIILTFYSLITRHLWKISEYAKHFKLTTDELLVLDKETNKNPDELDLVVNALNSMKIELINKQRHIQELNSGLENKVAERTSALKESNQLLVAKNLELNKTKLLLQQQQVELISLATHDPLTTLLNRRKLHQDLEKQWRASYRTHNSLAILMLDIDFFKRYNDHYGHSLGDQALMSLLN